MSQPQQIDSTWRPAPYWHGKLAGIVANAELLERCGLSVARLLARFVDPPPHYGQPPSVARRLDDGRRLTALPETIAEQKTREQEAARYLEVRNRLAGHYGLPLRIHHP